MNGSLEALRRRALAEWNVRLRRRPDGAYVATGSGAPGGSRDIIARNAAELRTVLTGWLAR